MATFTKTNGTLQPVFATDTSDGSVTGSTSLAGVPVNLQGPKLDFFTLTANVTANTAGDTGGYLSSVMDAIQQTATVAMYQVDGTNISVAVYPAGAYTTTTLLATANVAATGIQLDSCQDTGFKLADS